MRRVLITGDRHWPDDGVVEECLERMLRKWKFLVVIEGCARGADSRAHNWRTDHTAVLHEHYPAQWETYGKAAGPIRNKAMLDIGQPDIVFAFHNDLLASRGTRNMVDLALAYEVETWHVTTGSGISYRRLEGTIA